MKRIIIWGNRKEYDIFYKYVECEILKGNIIVSACIMNDKGLYKSWDNKDVYEITDILDMKYDYIVDMNQSNKEVFKKVIDILKLDKNKIIPIKVFQDPCFDFAKYVTLIENPVSIIASHCWGGFAYHSLGLRFHSPFINLFTTNDDYIKLAKNLISYLSLNMEYEDDFRDINNDKKYPIGRLNDVLIRFEHYNNWDEAKNIWDERLQRINYNNLFFEMTCRTEKEVEDFLLLPYEKKVAFTDIPIIDNHIINVEADEMKYVEIEFYKGNLSWYMCDKVVGRSPWSRNYDLIKLLCGEKDFNRGIF